MTNNEILSALTLHTGTFPEKAVRAATDRLPDLTPDLLQALEQAAAEPDRVIEEGGMLHTYAMYLLGHAREPRAFPLLLRLAGLPEEQIDGLIGDCVTEGLSQALASTALGNWEALKPLVEDAKAYEYCRNSGLCAMVCMVAEGDLEREPVLEYCHHLLTGGLEREYSYIWDGTIHVALDLGIGPCEAAIRKAIDEGMTDPWSVSPEDLERALKLKEPPDLRDSYHQHYRYLEDCETEMSWWYSFNREPDTERKKLTRSTARSTHSPIPDYTRISIKPVPRKVTKTGRNQPCPCGSGLKYKKCCGK